ncbi:MAG: Uma2 family endonuclease, partial [Oscillibacter sp.]|nr:Uma2 family endonuclease [Oscillibacter sp.]
KDLYERCGVREYWIVSPSDLTIEQYILQDGKFVLRDVYHKYDAYELEDMTDEERAAIVTEFQCSLFDDLTIRVDDVFRRLEWPG